jgi:hypothetical protein
VPVALIRVSQVSVADHSGDDLWGAHIDTPATGHETETYGLDVRGWALGRSLPVASIEVMHAGDCIWRVAPDVARADVGEQHPDVPAAATSGFFAPVNALTLPREWELQVRARLEDRTRIPIGVIRGSRAPLRSAYRPALAPLMVTTLGRTGSTAMIRLLGAHPGIAAYRPFKHEPRVVSYWMGVLKGLSEPSSYRRQISPTGPIDKTWWLGERPPLPRRVGDPDLDDWLGGAAVEDIAGFCQSRVDSIYGRIAGQSGGPEAVYFAEKLRPDWVPELVWELYPRAREIILVRDFRDMVSSMLAFNAKRGFQGFRRHAVASDADFVTDNVKGSAAALARAWKQRSESAHLVRYENLIDSPAETLSAMLDYLELDSSPAAIAAMQAGLTDRMPEDEGHRTTPDPAASLGRWRTDMSPELQEVCDRELGASLETFGYQTAGQPWS